MKYSPIGKNHASSPSSRFLFSAPKISVLAVAVCCWQVAAIADVFDDFADGNDTSNPTWTHSDVGLGGTQTFDASTFAYHLGATVGGFGLSYVGSFVGPSLTDFSVSFDLVNWGGGAQKFGAYGRATGINTAFGVSGYMFSYQADTSQVLLRQMTSANQAGKNLASIIFPLDTSKDYQFILRGSGSRLDGLVYEIGGPSTPLVELTATDTTWTSGVSGILGFGQGAATDFTVDNFAAVVPEPATSSLLLLGALAVGWPLLRRRAASK